VKPCLRMCHKCVSRGREWRRDQRSKETSYGFIWTGVSSGTSRQISSISALVTAMHPSVQSISRCALPMYPRPFGRPWIMMSPPGFTPAASARARSEPFGYEILSAL
jgi:hypothetical protein